MALQHLQSSITNILSFDVPNYTSLTRLASPNLSFDNSLNLGTILAPVAIAINSTSVPETHLTAGRLFYKSKWFASSSKPH
jgi:hypothetical protein